MTRPRPLAIVGALALAVLFAVHSAAALEPFTVLSYNVENWLPIDRIVGGKPATSGKPESQKTAAVAIIAAHRPAIVGVIEIGDRTQLDDLRSRLKTAGLDYPYVEWHEGLDPARHVALLSRFPIVARDSQDHVTFEINGQPNGIQRGILDITVEPQPGYRVRLLGLHLKSRRLTPAVDETALRAKESWFVRQTLDAFGCDPHHVSDARSEIGHRDTDFPIGDDHLNLGVVIQFDGAIAGHRLPEARHPSP